MGLPDRIDSFADAAALALAALERELGESVIWIGHLDRSRGVLQVVATGGQAGFGLEPGLEAELDTSFCQVMASGAGPQLVDDAAAHPAYGALPATAAMRVGSFVGAPLEVEGAAVATLCAAHHGRRAYTAHQLDLVRTFAAFLSRELERADLEQAVVDLRHQAETDPLTGIANRRALLRELESSLGDPRASLVLLDLDGFKAINDRHGHAAGDAALVDTARALQAACGPRDVAARLGGDEFAVVVHGDARAWLGALRAPVRSSAGHVALAAVTSSGEALELADARLYAAKHASLLAA